MKDSIVKDCLLVIDIGGSTIHSIILRPRTSTFIRFLSAATDRSKIDTIINDVVSAASIRFPISTRVLGIPGDISMPEPDGTVFCPPLGIKINISNYTTSGWTVVNDTIANSYFSLDAFHFNLSTRHSIVTLGTSFGFCTVCPSDLLGANFSRCDSYEYAHMPIASFELPLPATDHPVYYVHDMFSVSGLARLFNIEISAIPGSVVKLSDSIALAKVLDNPCAHPIFAEWIVAFLHLIVRLLQNELQVVSSVIVSGGLASLIVSSDALSEIFCKKASEFPALNISLSITKPFSVARMSQ